MNLTFSHQILIRCPLETRHCARLWGVGVVGDALSASRTSEVVSQNIFLHHGTGSAVDIQRHSFIEQVILEHLLCLRLLQGARLIWGWP